VNGGSWAKFSRDYRDISTRVGLPVIDEKEDDTFLQLKEWLESEDSGDWVLVVDNADNPSEFRDSRYIPQRLKGKLIVTTRSRRVANQLGCEPVEVPKMDANEAEVLFQRLYTGIVPATDTGLIRDLLEALEYLPLAIAGATAYMGETGTLPTEYLEIFNSTRTNQAGPLMARFKCMRRELQSEEEEGMTESVLATYYITFVQIQKLCPLSADLLRLFAFLDWQMVPERFLVESGLDGATDMVVFRDAVGYLLRYLLITDVSGRTNTDPMSYDAHRLVHLSAETYVSQDPDEAIIWKMRALGIVSRLFPVFRYEDRSICSAYFPHALAVIPYSDNTESTSLCENVADYLSFKGEYGAAEGHLIRCLEIRERAGNDTPTAAGSLAAVYDKQGDYSKALKWFSRALAGWETLLGKDHPSTLTTVNNMACVYGNQGDHNKALEWFGRPLAGFKKLLEKEHPSKLATVGNIARMYTSQGDRRKWFGRALAGFEKSLRKEHPSTLTADDMALTYGNRGDSKTLKWFGRALVGRENLLGKEHPDTLTTGSNVYDRQRDHSKALEWHGRAMAGRKKPDHPSNLTPVNMACVCGNQGDYTKAFECLGRALAGLKRSLGNDYPDIFTAVNNNMALVHDSQGDYSETLESFGRVLAGLEKLLGKDYPP
jgi:tetratricopeptide (TPR) repeat protein